MSSKIKYTTKQTENQAQSQLFDYQGNIQDYISSCRPKKRAIINAFIAISHRFKNIYASQTEIAKLAQVSREYCNRVIAELHADGFLWKVGRYRTSCLYKVPASIFKYQKQLKHILPALALLNVSLLFPKHDHTRYLNLFKLHRHKTDTVTNTCFITRDARERVVASTESYNLKKERESMKQNSQVLGDGISPVLENLKSIKLTTAGKVWMSAFDDKAQRAADDALSRKSGVSDAFRYLFAVAKKNCEERGVKPDWAKRSRLAQELSISESDAMVEEFPKKQVVKPLSDNSTLPKTKLSDVYGKELFDHYESLFRKNPSYRDRDILQGKLGTAHSTAYVDARTKIWAELNDSPEKQLARWENNLTPEVLAALDKLDPQSRQLRLKEREHAIAELKSILSVPVNIPEPTQTNCFAPTEPTAESMRQPGDNWIFEGEVWEELY